MSTDTSPSNVKRRKVVAERGFSNYSGSIASSYNYGENESFDSLENTRCSDADKNKAAIPAVPLRCLPTLNEQLDCGSSVPTRGKYDGDGQKLSNDSENKVGSEYDFGDSDLDVLSAKIAEAKSYIDMFNARHGLEEVPSKQSEINLDDDDEICVLSPEEWSTLQLHPKRRCDDGRTTVESQGIKTIGCAQSGTNFNDFNAAVEYYGIDDEVANGSDGHIYSGNHKDLINLSTVPYDHPHAIRTREILKNFEAEFDLVNESRDQGNKGIYSHFMLVTCLKERGMYVFPEKPFGHIPGVHVGDEFRFRSELAVIGLHHRLIHGIDCVMIDGKKFATSVINSGRYENEAKALDVLIYSGQGGNEKIVGKSVDQKLEKGNVALMNSMEMEFPVRVTFKKKSLVATNALGMSNEGSFVYVYDGLYTVNKMWQERDLNGKLIFKFQMHRLSGQPRPHRACVKPIKQVKCKEVCIACDISLGKEKLFIRAMNGVDGDRYPSFTYVTNVIYPIWCQRVEPIGCDCIDGCSDSQQCPCVLKNGGEIPYNEKGEIVKARPVVHECGPLCKCPPSCMNRVTQHGAPYQLEIFKTVARGWGVRSRNYITSGSFICEYVGELLRDKDAEQRINDDEYLFDISEDGEDAAEGEFQVFHGSKSNDECFAIDAARFGNVGRFINHSCSPNLYAQKVLYDHADKRIPHIMFFATRNIPPQQELTYDYNYKMDRVCNANGNLKRKACYCGSRKCTGRMY